MLRLDSIIDPAVRLFETRKHRSVKCRAAEIIESACPGWHVGAIGQVGTEFGIENRPMTLTEYRLNRPGFVGDSII